MNSLKSAGSTLRLLVTIISLAWTPALLAADGNGTRVLTVRDSIEVRRTILFGNEAGGASPIATSPSGERYIVFFQTADLATKSIKVEILAGWLTDEKAAGQLRHVAWLTTNAKTQSDGTLPPTYPYVNQIRWLDDEHSIAFLWTDGDSPNQVIKVNLPSGQIEQLTSHETPVREFTTNADGSVVIYSAAPPTDPMGESEDEAGFAVDSDNLIQILEGTTSRAQEWDYPTYYLSRPRDGTVRKIFRSREKAPPFSRGWPQAISPDGRSFLLLNFPINDVPKDWDRYDDPRLRLAIAHDRAFGTEQGFQIGIPKVVGLDGDVRDLWNAPGDLAGRSSALWTADASKVIYGPTFLPTDTSAGIGDRGEAIVEIDVGSGKFDVIELPVNSEAGLRPCRWVDRSNVEFCSRTGHWVTMRKGESGSWAPLSSGIQSDGISVSIVEDLNSPPKIVVKSAANQAPIFSLDVSDGVAEKFTLGKVANISWPVAGMAAASGRLYLPVNYKKEHAYPLVIQTNGHVGKAQFSLTGNLPDIGTVYSAQALANADIIVLQVQEKFEPGEKELAQSLAIYDGAIDKLVADGLIDVSNIGIIGYSRTGSWVLNSLIRSKYTYAAAIIADSAEPSYSQYLFDGDLRQAFEEMIGSAPIGEGLSAWIKKSPTFQLPEVQSPIRLEVDQFGRLGVLGRWETYSLLRELSKPVELYVIPSSEHGIHGLQMPEQQLASQTGTVDWFRFWLQDIEDPEPAKAEQYGRWRELRRLQCNNPRSVRDYCDVQSHMMPIAN